MFFALPGGLYKYFTSLAQTQSGWHFVNWRLTEMDLSWMILTFVSQGMIVFYWLTTLAIPFTSLFLCSSCWEWYGGYEWTWFTKFLYNVIPAMSSTSTFLIISATSLLAVCNRWFESTSIFLNQLSFEPGALCHWCWWPSSPYFMLDSPGRLIKPSKFWTTCSKWNGQWRLS